MPPLTRNQEITLKIDGLTSEGQGVGRYEGFAVFVPFALPGEEALVRIIKPSSAYAVGKLIELKTEAPERVHEPSCGAFYRCGGCQLQHMTYPAQLLAKRQMLVDALQRLGGFEGAEALVAETVGGAPYGYRNKGSFPVRSVDGAATAGMFAPRSHRLIPITRCPIACEEVNAALERFCGWLADERILGYDEEKHRGVVRHAAFRRTSSGLMAVIVTAGSDLPKKRALIDALEGVATNIVHNINSERTNTVLGKRSAIIWGEPLAEELLGLTFRVSDRSFLQVNHDQAQELYALALDALELKGTETALDAYSGVGTIALALAKRAARVVGIEYVKEAVLDAQKNAALNDIANAGFYEGAVEVVLPELVKETRFDAIVLDPPRKGCDKAALDAVIASKAKKVAYVSCNPATLARDAKALCEGGYTIVKATPVDMFPQTAHVEAVMLLQLKMLKHNNNSHKSNERMVQEDTIS